MKSKMKRKVPVSMLLHAMHDDGITLKLLSALLYIGERGPLCANEISRQQRKSISRGYKILERLKEENFIEQAGMVMGDKGQRVMKFKLTEYGEQVYYSITGKEARQ